MPKKLTVCLLYGGKSGEHEVSLQSAQSVQAALDTSKYDVVMQLIDKEGNPKQIATQADVFFPLIHGTYGEDGSLQGMLELLDVAYVGAGVLGSAIGMDKDVMKRLLNQAGIKTARFYTLKKHEATDARLNDVIEKLGLPVFIKPVNLGSSVGISKVKKREDLQNALDNALLYDTKVMIEEGIVGRELECSVLGNDDPQASIAGEVIPQREFYSYEAKYLDEDGAILKIPADLTPEELKKIQDTAIAAFKTLECAGMARVDFFLKKDGELLVNEINTIPGFTKISMYPKLWEASGLTYTALLDRLIELAIERKKQKDELKRSYD